MKGRSYNLENECTRVALTEDIDLSSFTYGDNDLDEFFRNDSRDYEREMLARSYAFITDDASSQPVAVFSVSNSSISMTALSSTVRNRMQRKIPNVKREKIVSCLTDRAPWRGCKISWKRNRLSGLGLYQILVYPSPIRKYMPLSGSRCSKRKGCPPVL